jgi:bifunctional pyridoxal-dependent enzyme with beta-cystathionase and maltose regulon repressor activities
MDLPTCPKIQRRLIARASHPAGFGYTIQPSRAWEAVSRWLDRHFSWKVDPSEMVFSASVVIDTRIHVASLAILTSTI